MTALVLTTLALAATSARPSENATPRPAKLKLAVMEIESGVGVDPKVAHLITSTVTSELRRNASLSVMGQEDLRSLMRLQREKQLLNCEDTGCMAEIGGALGAEQLITGSLGLLGGSYVFILRAVDVHAARVVRDVQRRLKSASPEALLDVVPEMVRALMPGAAGSASAPDAAVAAPQPQVRQSNAPWWLAGAGGAVALVGLGVFLPAVLGGSVHDHVTTYSYPGAQTANIEGYVGESLMAVGLAGALAGLGFGLLRGPAGSEGEGTR